MSAAQFAIVSDDLHAIMILLGIITTVLAVSNLIQLFK